MGHHDEPKLPNLTNLFLFRVQVPALMQGNLQTTENLTTNGHQD